MSELSWNEKIIDLPGASILQTSQWAEVKSSVGWTPIYKTWSDEDGKIIGAALILKRAIGFSSVFHGMNFLYIPRGPLLNWEDAELRNRIFSDLIKIAKEEHAIFIKIDPDVPVTFGVPGTEEAKSVPSGNALLDMYQEHNWVFSPQQIQFANSVWISLKPDYDTLLNNMKQRTRYKVRLAERNGIVVRHGTSVDFKPLYDMYKETAERDHFLIRPSEYYFDVWTRFFDGGMLTPLIAEYNGEAVAAIMLFTFGKYAWYIYGMSRNLHREKMPNYLLQWEAIKTAKSKGCLTYDLWGAPDHFDESDRMWGVYQFKRGLGGEVVTSPGAWDFPIQKRRYVLFSKLLPRFLEILKKKNGN